MVDGYFSTYCYGTEELMFVGCDIVGVSVVEGDYLHERSSTDERSAMRTACDLQVNHVYVVRPVWVSIN